MSNLTRIQKITISLIIAYVFWEFAVWLWAKSLTVSGPIIRVDLLIVYPIILTFIIISFYQYFKK